MRERQGTYKRHPDARTDPWHRLRRTARRLLRRLTGELDVSDYRRLGMQIGNNVHIGPGSRLDPATAFLITLGDDVVIGPAVQILAHDASLRRKIGYTRAQLTTIGDRVFIGANTVILPGVSIGDDVIVGAMSLVTRDIPSGSVAYGHPAQVVASVETLASEARADLGRGVRYDTPGKILTHEEQEAVRRDVTAAGVGWFS